VQICFKLDFLLFGAQYRAREPGAKQAVIRRLADGIYKTRQLPGLIKGDAPTS
jgi:hypothetical protein